MGWTGERQNRAQLAGSMTALALKARASDDTGAHFALEERRCLRIRDSHIALAFAKPGSACVFSSGSGVD